MEPSNESGRRIHGSQGRLRQFSVDIFQLSISSMKGGQSQDQVTAQGLVSKVSLRMFPNWKLFMKRRNYL